MGDSLALAVLVVSFRMYNVRAMKRYTVSVVRERLADALDEAQRGIPVIIERKGVRYRLTVEKTTARPKRRRPYIEVLDPSVANADWTWDWKPGGLAFKGRRRK
jgi:hypothetical protein